MSLTNWSSVEVEELLNGPAEILLSTFFGELVLTPELLRSLHEKSVAPIRQRWRPEVHQPIDTERYLRQALGEEESWSTLTDIERRLRSGSESLRSGSIDATGEVKESIDVLIHAAIASAESLGELHSALHHRDHKLFTQPFHAELPLNPDWRTRVRQLRAARHPVALPAVNLLADLHSAAKAYADVGRALNARAVAVLAEAGEGKTQLAAQVTAPRKLRPAGILLHGRDLSAGQSLDALASTVVIGGKPVSSMEALVAALDAAGLRAGSRLPIVIDGLNEAEDPRNWSRTIAALLTTLDLYPHVLFVCTVRPEFAEEALPEELSRYEMHGFERDTLEAIRRYFDHYKIDPYDALLPLKLLEHPLTLRIYCEVTNPKREEVVGVGQLPESLTALFAAYLETIAQRIAELAPRSWRFYSPDVHDALDRIGFALWQQRSRSVSFAWARRELDSSRPWDQSIVRALEHEGVLIRMPDRHGERDGQLEVVFDRLAGHVIADAILRKIGAKEFERWIQNVSHVSALTMNADARHPLASDILHALTGLVPRHYRRQLWVMLKEPLRERALHAAALLESRLLDRETVNELERLIVESPQRIDDLINRLQTTRAARSHPLDARFLDTMLRSMAMPDRDLRWTEWIRRNREGVIEDLKQLDNRWRTKKLRDGDDMRAQWVKWTLTSTDRPLRDHATRALYHLGCREPSWLFELSLSSLDINDPYVPDRTLSAAYGVAMSLWADPAGEKLRAELPGFADALLQRMYLSDTSILTRHVLMRDYALGIATLATKLRPHALDAEKLALAQSRLQNAGSPFPPAETVSDEAVEPAKGAIHMDFGNYTIGRLIPDRNNYDFEDVTYKQIRRQIEWRIVQLGYSHKRFAQVDDSIAQGAWQPLGHRSRDTDRYGKKYAWISFFEMYGLQSDLGAFSGWRALERSSDADIDPSFPTPPRVWHPPLPELFSAAPTEPAEWLARGPTPDYDHLLQLPRLQDQVGPWLLLDGYIEQNASSDSRRIFTFLRGLLVPRDLADLVITTMQTIDYPGNERIPSPLEDHYTYAGEIPWSHYYGSALRNEDGKPDRDCREALVTPSNRSGVPVEVPIVRFAWESYHSTLNQVSGIVVPAPALCEKLELTNRKGEWDFYSPTGEVASVYRESKREDDRYGSNFIYLRETLLSRYLEETGQVLIWMIWGERNFDYRAVLEMRDDLFRGYDYIHRRILQWRPDE